MLAYLVFGFFYTLSTIFSIDKYSSIFGYPTRIHGGLLSYLSYGVISFIYAASNFSQTWRERHLQVLLGSGVVISVYAVLQRFGVDASLWNQDVQSRVFGTFGQPNWMAAYLSVMLPIATYFVVREQTQLRKFLYVGILSICLVASFLSGSRSGLGGGLIAMLGVALCLGWSKNIWQKVDKRVLMWTLVGICLVSGYGLWINLWGRVETMTIRLAVWEGVWKIFWRYPWLGSGPETFAYVFYENRPAALLATAEWDLLYNKAHNEILHYLGTIGLIGTGAFGAYCLTMLYETKRGFFLGGSSLQIYLCCGWWSLWIAHLFGFSVTATGLLLFILPAIMNVDFAEVKKWPWRIQLPSIVRKSKTAALTVMLLGCVYLGVELSGLIAADLAYASYKEKFRQGNISAAIVEIEKAVRITPYNPWLRSELGWASASAVRVLLAQEHSGEELTLYEQAALEQLTIARQLAPRNTLIAQREVLAYAYLYQNNREKYAEVLAQQMRALQTALPNEIALLAQWPKIYAEIGRDEDAKALLQKFLDLKPDYENAREQLIKLEQEKVN